MKVISNSIGAPKSQLFRYLAKRQQFEKKKTPFHCLHSQYANPNCVSECLMNLAYNECNCAPFFMPPAYRNATVCGKEHHSCVTNLVNKYTGLLKKQFRCECHSACSEDSFTASASSTPLSDNSNIRARFGLPMEDMATVQVFFPSRSPYGFIRRESVKFTEFLCEY